MAEVGDGKRRVRSSSRLLQFGQPLGLRQDRHSPLSARVTFTQITQFATTISNVPFSVLKTSQRRPGLPILRSQLAMSPGVPLALPRSRTTPNVPAAVQRLSKKRGALSDHPTPDAAVWGHSPDEPVWRVVIEFDDRGGNLAERSPSQMYPTTSPSVRPKKVRAQVPVPKTAWQSCLAPQDLNN